MGQRLNIEIKSKNKVIANCYYHWSAFSEEALRLTKQIIDNFDAINDDNEILRAVRLLGITGAGVTRESISYMYKNIPNFDLTVTDGKPVGNYLIPLASSRDNGLIEIDEKKMEEVRNWEAGRITINIDNKTFDFDVLYEINDKKEVEDILKWGIKLTYDNFKLKDIPFKEIDNYLEIVQEIEENDGYFIINDSMYSLIF